MPDDQRMSAETSDPSVEMEKWVLDHGSSRLRKAQTAGLLENCWNIYREERLLFERPGWVLMTKEQGAHKKVLNPAEEWLDALLDARESWLTTSLVWLQGKGEPGEAWLVDEFHGRMVGIPALRYFEEGGTDG